MIDLVNKNIQRIDGGNLRKTKNKITRIKNKKTVYNKMSDYLENGWFKIIEVIQNYVNKLREGFIKLL